MKKFKVMFYETFYGIEAENETEAERICREELMRELKNNEQPFIVWEEPNGKVIKERRNRMDRIKPRKMSKLQTP